MLSIHLKNFTIDSKILIKLKIQLKVMKEMNKKELIALYYNGKSVSDICLQNDVSRSTFYTWLKPYQIEVTPSGHIVSASEFIKMKQQFEKLK